MSFDPFAQEPGVPQPGYDAPPLPANPAFVRSRVLGPAIALIVVGILNLLMAAVPGYYAVAASWTSADQLEKQMEKDNPKQLADLKAQGWSVEDVRKMIIGGSITCAVVDFLGSFVVLFGGLRMLNLKSYGLSILAAIVASVPVVSCSGCCGLGAIAGIWAIIVLINPEVREAFR